MKYKESYRGLCHGTDEISATHIIEDGFIPSKREGNWCGAGVYFYDIKAKAWWSANRTCAKIEKEMGKKLSPKVVYADIIDIPNDDIFDMRTQTDLSAFEQAIKQVLENELGKLEIKTAESEEERIIKLRSMLIDFYVSSERKKLVIGIFRQRPNSQYEHNIEFADSLHMVFGVETIYCVKDTGVLSNIH